MSVSGFCSLYVKPCWSYSVMVYGVTMPQWVHIQYIPRNMHTFLLCCGYTLTDFPISIRLTSLALWQSNDCPSASKATLMNMDKYFMWIHYERWHNHNKAKHNKTVCIFLGINCTVMDIIVDRDILYNSRADRVTLSIKMNCLMQYCSISSASEMELLQSCTKQWLFMHVLTCQPYFGKWHDN